MPGLSATGETKGLESHYTGLTTHSHGEVGIFTRCAIPNHREHWCTVPVFAVASVTRNRLTQRVLRMSIAFESHRRKGRCLNGFLARFAGSDSHDLFQ